MVSLSEPHTNVAHVHVYASLLACLFGLTTYYKFQTTHSNFEMSMCTVKSDVQPRVMM